MHGRGARRTVALPIDADRLTATVHGVSFRLLFGSERLHKQQSCRRADGMGYLLPTSRAPRDSDEHLTAVFDRRAGVIRWEPRTPQRPQSEPPRKRMNFDYGEDSPGHYGP